MRKLLALLLFLPCFVIAQNKNVVTASRYFPKPDKVAEFEKALAAHAQKYHKGDQAWRVFEIQSGPDAGGYHVTEGPTSWTAYDSRGDMGAEHMTDFNKTVSIHLAERTRSSFSTFNTNMSTTGLTDWADKIIIGHWLVKPGKMGEVNELLGYMRKVWQADGDKVAVYNSFNSGPPQVTTVVRLTGGLKDIDAASSRKPYPERYIAANGADAWAKYVSTMENCVENRWSEVLFYRADLSSK